MAPSPADNSTPMLTVSTYKSGPAVTPGVHSDLNPKREKRKNNFILRRIRKKQIYDITPDNRDSLRTGNLSWWFSS